MNQERFGRWMSRWRHVIAYLFIAAVFVWVVHGMNELRDRDVESAQRTAETLRMANVRFCEASNERTVVLRDFILTALADPDPKQFDFITDPALRQGVIDQTRRSRADMRARVTTTFTLRDCAADFPPPPDGH